MSEYLDLLMTRAENGLQHANDASILFEAFKHAAQTHTVPEDTLKFLKHHLERGYESFKMKEKQKQKQEH